MKYQELVDSIFGTGVIDVSKVKRPGNNVIGTLENENSEDPNNFKIEFTERLKRINDIYKHRPCFDNIKKTLVDVNDANNWEGAYAELVVYDLLGQVLSDIGGDIILDKDEPASESYAGEMGMKVTNEDIYLPEYNMYADVKILGDTIKNILQPLIREVEHELQGKYGKRCDILPEYPLDDDDADYAVNREALRRELINNLKEDKTYLQSTVIPTLCYRIKWGGGVNSSMSEYAPYRHAQNTFNMIFKRYTKKIMKNAPFYLIFVQLPWYNNLVSSFADANLHYYRALCRRVFMQYRYNDKPVDTVVPKFKGTETLYQLSSHITGIIFIEDLSITKSGENTYIFLNPNAVNKPLSMQRHVLEEMSRLSKDSIYDDMEYDNY